MRTLALPALLVATLSASAQTAPAWRVTETSWLGFRAIQQDAEFEGRFDRFDAEIAFDPSALGGSRFYVTVHMASVNTGYGERDDELRRPDLFDVQRFPEALFVAEDFHHLGEDSYEALGELTMRDQTRVLTLPFRYTRDGDAATLTGGVTISRLDYGVGQGDWADTRWVGEDVTIEFNLALELRTG